MAEAAESRPTRMEPKGKHDSIIDLKPYVDKRIRVTFSNGREATGILLGADHIRNLVLDDTIMYSTNEKGEAELKELGLIFARGQAIITFAPEEGYALTSNPFETKQ